jgi:hypothetical protein
LVSELNLDCLLDDYEQPDKIAAILDTVFKTKTISLSRLTYVFVVLRSSKACTKGEKMHIVELKLLLNSAQSFLPALLLPQTLSALREYSTDIDF